MSKEAKIEHEKTSEFLKRLDIHDPIFNEADEYEYTEWQLLEFAERFANEQTQPLKDKIESVRVKLIGIALRTTDDDTCQRLEDIFKPLRPKQ